MASAPSNGVIDKKHRNPNRREEEAAVLLRAWTDDYRPYRKRDKWIDVFSRFSIFLSLSALFGCVWGGWIWGG